MKSNNEGIDDLKINKKESIKIYTEYDPYQKKPFRLFEKESFFDSWRVVDVYETLSAAQESGLSRASKVIDLGVFGRKEAKGIFSWFDKPQSRPTPQLIPRASANMDCSEVVKFEPKVLKK